jgi:hypothetical protein
MATLLVKSGWFWLRYIEYLEMMEYEKGNSFITQGKKELLLPLPLTVHPHSDITYQILTQTPQMRGVLVCTLAKGG